MSDPIVLKEQENNRHGDWLQKNWLLVVAKVVTESKKVIIESVLVTIKKINFW